jgi:2,4-dienoyl-CoA reductase-like NADH-dependent reductase (Old Yellow Enzyme family)
MNVVAAELRHLWSPLRIGAMTVKHRVMVTGHTVLFGEGGFISGRHIDYYAERARGGAALIVIEQQAAHPSGRNYLAGCTAYEPKVVPHYARLAAACHAHGAKVMAQLFCGGAQGQGTAYIDAWRPLLAPSTVASTQFQELPAEMDRSDIADVIDGFVRSARHCRDAGLDGVEIHAAHSQLLGSFLSPAFNRRRDAYGGSLANRCRFVLEIGEGVRKAVGPDFTVGLRISASEFLPRGAGITLEAAEQQVEIFAHAGLFDFFDVSAGGYYAKHVSVTPQASDQPPGFLAPHAKRIKAVAGNRAKVFVVGRVWDLRVAEEIIATGAADMVAMTRAHMADPFLVAKARSGRADEIVTCVGANVCVRRLGEQNHVVCVMNPSMGREAVWGEGSVVRSDKPRAIAVIGGGPAGLKLAARAAERGHRVSLFEASAALGGRLKRLAKLPLRGRWNDAIANLARPVERSGVELHLGRPATEADLAGFESVVFATGARFDAGGFSAFRPERDAIPGALAPGSLGIDLAIDRALADPTSLGRKVVILDETQDALPAGLAEILASAGVGVELITPMMFFGDALARSYDLGFIMPRLIKAGVRISPQSFVERIDGPRVHAYGIWDSAPRVIDDVDHVVMSLSRLPNQSLFRSLVGCHRDVRRIGDCLAPRSLEAVIYEGEKLGREI